METVDKKNTKQVRISIELHRLLKVRAAQEKTTIKSLIEGALSSLLSPIKNENK